MTPYLSSLTSEATMVIAQVEIIKGDRGDPGPRGEMGDDRGIGGPGGQGGPVGAPP